jgi:hypothetical protein
MEIFGMFGIFRAFWFIVHTYGPLVFCDNFATFSPVLVFCTKKNLATLKGKKIKRPFSLNERGLISEKLHTRKNKKVAVRF